MDRRTFNCAAIAALAPGKIEIPYKVYRRPYYDPVVQQSRANRLFNVSEGRLRQCRISLDQSNQPNGKHESVYRDDFTIKWNSFTFDCKRTETIRAMTFYDDERYFVASRKFDFPIYVCAGDILKVTYTITRDFKIEYVTEQT